MEEKLFFRKEGVVQPYVALDFVYAHTDFKDIQDFRHIDNNGYASSYTDTFSVDKRTIAVNGKFGLQIVVKHFVVETTVGVGVKYHDATHGDRLAPKDYFDHSDNIIPTAEKVAAREGHYFTLNVPFNFKLGFVF
ncbi:MAG: hypothetical protein JWO58_679 [Chitinophagaceae bacterium]|nr:hypothetical protein [Chitinophagaceae bacterium]